jgi:hypothetical protein
MLAHDHLLYEDGRPGGDRGYGAHLQSDVGPGARMASGYSSDGRPIEVKWY